MKLPAAAVSALVKSVLWGLSQALDFSRTDEARALVERLMGEDRDGDQKRREVRAVFFRGASGWAKYLADALITVLVAQAAARLGNE